MEGLTKVPIMLVIIYVKRIDEQSAESVLNNEARLKKCPYLIDDTAMKKIISI